MKTAVALAGLALCAAAASAQNASDWQPSLYLLGTSEHGAGSAYAPPNDALRRDTAASVAFGLDGRQSIGGGHVEASAFALLHDPFASERGFSLTGRARGVFGPAGGRWRIRFEESPRVQRRETVTLSDFQRNDAWIGIETDTADGLVLGLRVGDRRRSVEGDPKQGFNRQSLLATIGGGMRTPWRFEVGPQRFSTETLDGWRGVASFEILGDLGGTKTALRVGWIEPFEGGGSAAALYSAEMAPAAPVPTPVALPLPGDGRNVSVEPTVPGDAATPTSTVPHEGLLGPALIVDPLEGDESDWDFGRRKQEIVAVAARRFGAFQLTGELRAQIERNPSGLPVRRERLVARLHLRRDLGRRVALIAQGGWQRLHDNRPGLGYEHGIASIGLQLRP